MKSMNRFCAAGLYLRCAHARYHCVRLDKVIRHITFGFYWAFYGLVPRVCTWTHSKIPFLFGPCMSRARTKAIVPFFKGTRHLGAAIFASKCAKLSDFLLGNRLVATAPRVRLHHDRYLSLKWMSQSIETSNGLLNGNIFWFCLLVIGIAHICALNPNAWPHHRLAILHVRLHFVLSSMTDAWICTFVLRVEFGADPPTYLNRPQIIFHSNRWMCITELMLTFALAHFTPGFADTPEYLYISFQFHRSQLAPLASTFRSIPSQKR